MKYQVNKDTIIEFYGKTYNVQQFQEEFACDNLDNAIGAIGILIKKGEAKVVQSNSKQAKSFAKIQKEEEFVSRAEEVEFADEAHKDFIAKQNREGKLTHGQVEFDFGSLLKAQQFGEEMIKALRLKNTEVSIRSGAIVLIVRDITDSELAYMNRYYRADMFTQNAIGAIDKTASIATDAVHYGATKVVAPMVQVGAKAGANIFKTLLTTAAKTAGTLVSATSQGVKSAAHEIRYDADVLKAGKELIETKDAAKRKFSELSGNVGSGGGRIIR